MREFLYETKGGISEHSAIIALSLIIAVGAMVYITPKIKSVFVGIGEKID